MLREAENGQYYKKSGAIPKWVEQEKGTVWQTKQGVTGALVYAKQRCSYAHYEIVAFGLIEVGILERSTKPSNGRFNWDIGE